MGAVFVIALRSDTNSVLEGRIQGRHFEIGVAYYGEEVKEDFRLWGKLYTLPLRIAPPQRASAAGDYWGQRSRNSRRRVNPLSGAYRGLSEVILVIEHPYGG
jgi:hypothetical protein